MKKHKLVSYAKWGYIFIAPFFIIYIVFQLVPLLSTFYYSFFENYRSGLNIIGPNFIGLQNYVTLFTPDSSGSIDILTYFVNTLIMWVLGAVPQLLFSLLLAVIFTSERLRIKGQRFFKTVMYMPNLIMAAAFAMLFFMLFSKIGPVNQLLFGSDTANAFDFFANKWGARGIIAGINFLMWFGNTTILLMAGIMGIDQSLFEAASIDGATSWQVFYKITIPLLKPIMVYVAITSLIGGLQMFDVPQVIGTSLGSPNRSTMTMIMYLNNFLGTAKNYGMAGALSVIIFIITGILSIIVYKTMATDSSGKPKKAKKGA